MEKLKKQINALERRIRSMELRHKKLMGGSDAGSYDLGEGSDRSGSDVGAPADEEQYMMWQQQLQDGVASTNSDVSSGYGEGSTLSDIVDPLADFDDAEQAEINAIMRAYNLEEYEAIDWFRTLRLLMEQFGISREEAILLLEGYA